MKKLLLLSILGGAALGAQAQQAKPSVVFHPERTVSKNISVQAHKGAVEAPTAAVANKGTALVSRWYNHAFTLGKANGLSESDMMDNNHLSFQVMWQDSSVLYPSGGGIDILSMAQVFDPMAEVYNDEFIYPEPDLLRLNSTTPYTLDSVSVLGRYERTNTGYVDTLIFTFLKESATAKYGYLGWVGSSDTFAVLLWAGDDYLTNPINQISYSIGGVALPSAVQVKVPLNDAIFADSTDDGLHLISVASNISVAAGAKIAVSVTFKSGTAYTAGADVTDYNFFQFASHEVNPGAAPVVLGPDNSMSYVVLSDSTGSQLVAASGENDALNFYYPATGFGPTYPLDEHHINWKITANVPTSVANVNSGITAEAYPNPANSTLNVPVTVKAAGNVTVNITNAMGQVVATQNLGQVAAGQKATATFNTSALANGVYFYTVEANGQRLTQRFAVSR